MTADNDIWYQMKRVLILHDLTVHGTFTLISLKNEIYYALQNFCLTFLLEPKRIGLI